MRRITFEGQEYDIEDDTVAVARDLDGAVHEYSCVPVLDFADDYWFGKGGDSGHRIYPVAEHIDYKDSLLVLDPC